jgi:hypothetical protein
VFAGLALLAELDDLFDFLELDQVSDQRSHGDVLSPISITV